MKSLDVCPHQEKEADKKQIRSLVFFTVELLHRPPEEQVRCVRPNTSGQPPFLIAALLPEQHRLSDQDTPWQYCKLVTFSEANTGRPVKTGCNIIFAARRSHCCCVVSTAFLSVDSCNSMLSTEARVSPKNRDKGLHSLRTSTVEVPSFIFFVVTLGTFRRQAAEDLRVYVRGQKMIDSLGCKGGVKTFSAFRTLRTTALCCKLQQDIHF